MTGMIRNPHARTLCNLAKDDELVLSFPLPDHIYGFHAQQSCEKFLKALITSLNRTYPLTHSLEKLSELLIQFNESIPVLSYDLLNLEPFAVEHRYDMGGRMTESDRILVRESVATLRDHVILRILEIEAISEV